MRARKAGNGRSSSAVPLRKQEKQPALTTAAASSSLSSARTRRRSPAASPRHLRGRSRSPSLPPVRGASRSPSVGQSGRKTSRSSSGSGSGISRFSVSPRRAVGSVSPRPQQHSSWSRLEEQEAESQEDALIAAARVLQYPELGYDYDELTRKIDALAVGRRRQPDEPRPPLRTSPHKESASASCRVEPELVPMTLSFALMQCLVRFQPPNVAAFVRVWTRASEEQRSGMHREALLLPRPANANVYCRDITPEVVDVMAQGFEFAARQGLDRIESNSDQRTASSVTPRIQLPPVEKHGAYQRFHRELDELDSMLAECRLLHGAVSGELPDAITTITSTTHCVNTLARLRACARAAREAGVPALKKQLRHASTMESLLVGLVPKLSAATTLQAVGRGFLQRLRDGAAREAKRLAAEIAAAQYVFSRFILLPGGLMQVFARFT